MGTRSLPPSSRAGQAVRRAPRLSADSRALSSPRAPSGRAYGRRALLQSGFGIAWRASVGLNSRRSASRACCRRARCSASRVARASGPPPAGQAASAVCTAIGSATRTCTSRVATAIGTVLASPCRKPRVSRLERVRLQISAMRYCVRCSRSSSAGSRLASRMSSSSRARSVRTPSASCVCRSRMAFRNWNCARVRSASSAP